MCITGIYVLMDVLCERYPVEEMTSILASKRIFAAAATGGACTAELPNISELKSGIKPSKKQENREKVRNLMFMAKRESR